MAGARETAMKVIYAVEYDGAYSNMALKNALSGVDNDKDKPFITSLVYGVIDKKLTLDYAINRYSKLKLKKISKYILIILRMGIYQLMFMDKVPESAAVNESVKLAKRYGHGASAGFVNGVLRSFAKSGIDYPDDKTEYLSVKYSFPAEMCTKWIKQFGYEFTEELLCSFGTEPKLTLRPNVLKVTAEDLCKKLCDRGLHAEIKDKCVISQGFDINSDEFYRQGMYTVQDIAAQQASYVLAPQRGDTVIDMCAAPGGKTCHMAELMGNEGVIYAFDVHEHKIELIRKNAERLGITIIRPLLSDGRRKKEEFTEQADKVLCDVPCSGFGIIRRKPEIKWNREDTSGLPQLQRSILDTACMYLKRGGEIVYSTCTIEKEENEAVTGGFLADNTDFEKLYEKTFYPNIDDTDGFYICKMRRKS